MHGNNKNIFLEITKSFFYGGPKQNITPLPSPPLPSLVQIYFRNRKDVNVIEWLHNHSISIQ